MSEAIVARAAVLGAISHAAEVELSAYVLQPEAALARALEAAADRGARVRVRLEGAPYEGHSPADGPAAANRRVAAELRAHGVDVRLTRPDDPSLHLKAALIDGTAYLDDRNWPAEGADTIVATNDPSDVRLVAEAFGESSGSDANLATDKEGALRFEADAIAGGTGGRVDVESESFGYSAVSKALYARARAGSHVRLLVAEREFAEAGSTERGSLRRLANAGVDVRVVASDEKLCVAGGRGWIGSANATYSKGPVLDWGLATCDPVLLGGIASAFERNWARARPVSL